MQIIRPTVITDAMLQSSNIPETDTTTDGEWAVGTAYHVGDTVLDTAAGVHKIYKSIQAGTGHDPVVDLALAIPLWWKLVSSTNRWKVFDSKVQSQSSQATSLNWVLNPGLIDSMSLHNLDATEVQIIMADQNTDLVTNGKAWTGATGTTQPTGWDKVGTPSGFLIDSGELKITSDAANEGISQTITVVPGTEMQLLGKYKNTAGDIAQYAVYDVTHAADIMATTDLGSSTVDSSLTYVFTVPAGCASVKVSLLAKSSGDIVWFDTVSLSDVVYNETETMLSTIAVIDWYTYFFEPIVRPTEVVRTNLAVIGAPPISTASVTIIVTNTGGTAKCGEVVMGLKFSVGQMKYSPTFSMIDYSQKTEDEYGNMSVTEGAYKTRLECSLLVKNSIRSEVHRQLILYRATPTAFIGSEADRDSDLILYGFYESFDTVIPYPEYSEMSLVAISLT